MENDYIGSNPIFLVKLKFQTISSSSVLKDIKTVAVLDILRIFYMQNSVVTGSSPVLSAIYMTINSVGRVRI